jgi:magnesium transporter
MEFSEAAAILRQISLDERETILAGLPRRQRHSFELTLSFPPDTVGAHLSTTIDVLSADDTVEDALRLKKDHQEVRSTLTFVVNEDRQLLGAVDLLTLIKRPGKTRLSDLADATYAAVSPQMPLSQAASLDAWRRFDELPVMSRRGELLGVIFRQFEQRFDEGTADPAPETLTSAAFSLLGYCTLELLDLLDTYSPDQPGIGGPRVD